MEDLLQNPPFLHGRFYSAPPRQGNHKGCSRTPAFLESSVFHLRLARLLSWFILANFVSAASFSIILVCRGVWPGQVQTACVAGSAQIGLLDEQIGPADAGARGLL